MSQCLNLIILLGFYFVHKFKIFFYILKIILCVYNFLVPYNLIFIFPHFIVDTCQWMGFFINFVPTFKEEEKFNKYRINISGAPFFVKREFKLKILPQKYIKLRMAFIQLRVTQNIQFKHPFSTAE